VDEEIAHYLDEGIAAHEARGLSREEATRAARLDLGGAMNVREQVRASGWEHSIGISWLDVRLGVRMLLRYKGLTLAGGLALAIAIGLGAGWHDVMRTLLHPTIPLPEGHRLVEVELRNTASSAGERRVLHDFLDWRKEVRTIEDLGAYRTLERNLILADARPEPVRVAEITASAFRLTRVPPLLGRPLLDADEQPGAPPVVVLGYHVWQQQFGGRPDAIGQTLQLGRAQLTVVGVMPEGFAFPENHKFWIPLQLRSSGYAPLEGPQVGIFGRLAPEIRPAQATAELAAVTSRVAATSPETHQHLRPLVFQYGGENDLPDSWTQFAFTHGPVLLVLLVACVNVGTLVYARTATREAEIALRHALGASRARIVGQLFVEALVLAAIAAGVGLFVADLVLRWVFAFLAQGDGLPFWIRPGLKVETMIYTALLAVVAAALLSVLPALKATGATGSVGAQLKTSGVGGATLRFGKVWTTAMIAQVALTVICIVPATGITWETIRDRLVRRQFPAAQYLAVEITVDRDEPAGGGDDRVGQTYGELERRIAQEPGVLAITFGDHLPGMIAPARRAELEASPGAEPVPVPNLWVVSVGPGYFETFDRPILSGRDFHNGDLANNIIVNEAFARLYSNGVSPVGRRVRFAGSAAAEASADRWLEIVGMVRDIGMTPIGLGEAPHMYRAASPATASPLVMGVRLATDPSALAQRVREIAVEVDPNLRFGAVQSLEDVVWSYDATQIAISSGIAGVVSLGLFLSAAGIFSLMSVSVARRTREIGLRIALGASPGRVLRGIFARALVLVGSGILAGNAMIVTLMLTLLSEEVDGAFIARVVFITSSVMLTVGLLGCIEPARRALRINPIQALKET
jgi:predicted permease